ncbi:RhoGEF domain containing protein [Ceratobasidium theobromae]|uniref:RhoGEF domain containing protein n=1 Tax=Ceratobasidium theobromae TaxID=1582974 RepID=A0A5N5QUQ8_9AGAM|nr:RhoGEF domain containing protein [Ceratobasidium theobromae]
MEVEELLGDVELDVPVALSPRTVLAMHELVASEEAFVWQLERLVQHHVPRLGQIFSAQGIAAVVRNAHVLLAAHGRLAAALAGAGHSRTALCRVLVAAAPELTALHSAYCDGHAAAAALVERARTRDAAVWAAWEREAPPERDGSRPRALGDVLIAPVQRVCRYHLLVAGLCDGTEGAAVAAAVGTMQAVAAAVDDIARRRDDESRVRTVLERMDATHPPGFLAALGPCLLVGTLDVVYYTASHPLDAYPKPPKAKHLAAFLWPTYLVLCKVHTRRARYEPRHWFPLRIVSSGVDSGVDCDPDDPDPDTCWPADAPPYGPGHVDVAPAADVFPYGIRISFARHVFELGAACAEERDIWLASIASARTGSDDADIARSNAPTPDRASREKSKSRERPKERPVERLPQPGDGPVQIGNWIVQRLDTVTTPATTVSHPGIAERLENAFLRDRTENRDRYGYGHGYGYVAASQAYPSAYSPPLTLVPPSYPPSVASMSTTPSTTPSSYGPNSTPTASTYTSTPTLARKPSFCSKIPDDARTLGPTLARSDSLSTAGSRSPSPVATSQSLIPQPQPAPGSQPIVRRPSSNARDPIISALADVISSTCREARDRATIKRKPLWVTPEEAAAQAEAAAAKSANGVMSMVRPRRMSSALVNGRPKLADAALDRKDKKKPDVRPSSSEGVAVDKTPLQRKRATIHGAMHAFPSMDSPTPESEPLSQSVPALSSMAQAAPGPISPPRSRTVSSSGSFVEGMRELLSLRRMYSKSVENMALAAIPHAPNPIYAVGAGLTNTRSHDGLARANGLAAATTTSTSTREPELYSLGAGITNTSTIGRKRIKSLRSSSGSILGSIAAFTKRRSKTGQAPLSALTFTPLSQKNQVDERAQTARSRSNEWYHPVPACRAPTRGMLGPDLYTQRTRVHPSPVAEEGRFATFGDEVYDENRY